MRISGMKKFILSWYQEPKISLRDKRVIVVLIFLGIIPPLFIPAWNSLEGFILTYLSWGLVFEFFFKVVDQTLFLSHFPFSMKAYQRIKKFSGIFTFLLPDLIVAIIFEYKRDPII